jgi:glyoxylase-like metal-dependent hydrolase (beta-lactamase superfamily II)
VPGGLTVAGKRAFPNALVHLNRRDAEYWLDPANLASAPEGTKKSFPEATASLKPYVDAGRFRVFADNASPIPGFGSILRPGHTPGHSSIVVESKGETFVVWGDISHGDAVQFDRPDVAIDFDVDSQTAAATRRTPSSMRPNKAIGWPGRTFPFQASAMFGPTAPNSTGWR